MIISINPYKRLPFYSSEVIAAYQHHNMLELPPHMYVFCLTIFFIRPFINSFFKSLCAFISLINFFFLILIFYFRYALAKFAFESMNRKNQDQCIIVTGESGSGKTGN